MLDKLQAAIEGPLRKALADPAYPWRTVDVTYEDPHVERLWTQVGDDRLYLHRIHPCEKPLFHPHPWPSACVIMEGRYEMRVGRGVDASAAGTAATIELAAGSRYEMVDEYAWHSVRPIGGPVLSIMVSGPPWSMPHGFLRHGKGQEHKELDDDRRRELVALWRGSMWRFL